MDREHIIAEIKRTAEANRGTPLGRCRFECLTGIRTSDWQAHWNNWGDAVTEAGFQRNSPCRAHSEDYLLASLVGLIREIRRFPVVVDLRRAARNDRFPAHNTFGRLGPKKHWPRKVIEYCRKNGDLDDVITICDALVETKPDEAVKVPRKSHPMGSVYLVKAGRYYKIGRTNSVGRREYELTLQLPEKPNTIHTVQTDDPAGIEEYWHRRFRDKRKNGEWFQLSSDDVRVFRSRKTM